MAITMNPPHPNTPTRSTKLFFPLALVFCQRCLAFSDGGLSSEQYHRHKLMIGYSQLNIRGSSQLSKTGISLIDLPELAFTDDATVVTSAANVVMVVPNVVSAHRLAVFSLSDPPAQRAWQCAAQVGAPRVRMIPIERKQHLIECSITILVFIATARSC